MDFKSFNELLQKHVKTMMKEHTHYFVVDVTKEEVWNTYLDSFPQGTNNIFRERREYDCSCCRSFINQMGRVVSIEGDRLVSIWDFQTDDSTYQPVVDALSRLIHSKPVYRVFTPESKNIGTYSNFETLTDQEIRTWYHFYTELPKNVKIFRYSELGSVQGEFQTTKQVLKRSLELIDPEALETVLELIGQNSLYRGEEWQRPLKEFQKLQNRFNRISSPVYKDLFCWKQSVAVGPAMARIKNHSIGVLLTDISEGMDLDEAVKRYEKIVAPTNYKRPKAIFTKKMVQAAQKTVQELGVEASLPRRFAELSDITVNNTLFANRDAHKVMGGVFEELASTLPDKPKNLSKVEEISVEKFVKDILPFSTEVEVLFDGKHEGNLVSLIAPQNAGSKSMFKWGNNFAWAYNGNIADSMKERVKAHGGKVDGVLRFSIQWNDNQDNEDDLDAHCIEPNNFHIYFSSKHDRKTGGNLDVDIVNPNKRVAVENITWPSKRLMPRGLYRFFVNNFSARGARSGFTAEIEFDGQIYNYCYARPLRQDENIYVADIEFDGQNFKIKHNLDSKASTKEVWNIATNKFHPASIIMYSPNYWDGQGVGNRHYFFMLKNCINPNNPNGFFNEFLNQDLVKHKRVFEALGSKMAVADSDKQLSGLGFSSTKRDELVCRVKGSFERLLKVKF